MKIESKYKKKFKTEVFSNQKLVTNQKLHWTKTKESKFWKFNEYFHSDKKCSLLTFTYRLPRTKILILRQKNLQFDQTKNIETLDI